MTTKNDWSAAPRAVLCQAVNDAMTVSYMTTCIITDNLSKCETLEDFGRVVDQLQDIVQRNLEKMQQSNERTNPTSAT